MRSTKRIHPYVSPEIDKRLRQYCAARDVTESAVVQAAIQEYLDGDIKDNVLIMRRLDRLGRAVDRLQRDVDVHAEAFAVFVRLWSGYLPQLGAAEHEAAKCLAQARYKQFAEVVAQQFAAGARLVADIVKEDLVADQAELAAAAAAAGRQT